MKKHYFLLMSTLIFTLLPRCFGHIPNEPSDSVAVDQLSVQQFLTSDIEGSFQEEIKSTDSNEISISTALGNNPIIPLLSESVESGIIQGSEIEVRNLSSEVEAPLIANKTDTAPTEEVNTTNEQDIPSFSEWTQKQLAERKKITENGTGLRPAVKIRRKNYASPDCGAKVVAANPEAVSSSSVLTSSRDEYMLNHCSTRIWFIVELCEAIQAQQLDLANFELFSSSPKDFAVFISARFPTREWSPVGKFSAQDSRDIQSFTLSPLLFGKFIKVELLSHYGREHYCPLSWVRLFGTSEYEVLATEDDRQTDEVDDVEEDLEGEAGKGPQNLLSSATQAVLTIVRKATAPFRRDEKNQKDLPKQEAVTPSSCQSPRYLTVCDNCSQQLYDSLFYLLSCQGDSLYRLVNVDFVRRNLIYTDMCQRFGLDFVGLRTGAPYPLRHPAKLINYLNCLVGEIYTAALCNVLAVVESRVLVNTSWIVKKPIVSESPPCPATQLNLITMSTCGVSDFSTTSVVVESTLSILPDIKPTKTLKEKKEEEKKAVDSTISESTSEVTLESITPPKLDDLVNSENPGEDASLAAILHDLSALEQAVTATQMPTPSKPTGDSIFLRLANRIKNLEINMSLSSSYLEEMSRRYRVQLEALSKTVNLTAMRIEEVARSEKMARSEQITFLEAEISSLKAELYKLQAAQQTWFPRSYQFLPLLLHLLLYWLLSRGRGRSATTLATSSTLPPPPKRTTSVIGVAGHEAPRPPLKRRPSDEALEVAVTMEEGERERKRQRKKRKEGRKVSGAGMEEPKALRTESEEWQGGGDRGGALGSKGTDLVTFNRFAMFESPGPISKSTEPLQPYRRFSSPAFIKTALSTRAERQVAEVREQQPEATQHEEKTKKLKNSKKELGLKKYVKKLF